MHCTLYILPMLRANKGQNKRPKRHMESFRKVENSLGYTFSTCLFEASSPYFLVELSLSLKYVSIFFRLSCPFHTYFCILDKKLNSPTFQGNVKKIGAFESCKEVKFVIKQLHFYISIINIKIIYSLNMLNLYINNDFINSQSRIIKISIIFNSREIYIFKLANFEQIITF